MKQAAQNSREFVRRMISFEEADDSVTFHCKTQGGKDVRIVVSVLSPTCLRFRLLPPGTDPGRKSHLVLPRSCQGGLRSVKETSDRVELATDSLTFVVEKDPWEFAILDAAGRPVCRENLADLDVVSELAVDPLGFSISEDGQTARVFESLFMSPDEHFYGLGEKFTDLDKRGQDIVLWHYDAFSTATERAYKNVPFFMSTRGYGIFIDTTCRVSYQFGTRSCLSYTFEAEDTLLDFYIIYGPSLKEILSQYTDLTGRPPVPPKWSFGLWMDGGAYPFDWTQESVAVVRDKMRELDIPCDVLSVDPYWMRERMYCDFRWDSGRFPDPGRMIAQLKEKGYKICLWIQPYVSNESEFYQEGREQGYFALRPDSSVYDIPYGLSEFTIPGSGEDPSDPENTWNARCGVVDFSNPQAKRWFQLAAKPIIEMGGDTFMVDFGEAIPEDALFHNGMSGKEMHNLYPLLYSEAVAQAIAEFSGRRPVFWARSGYAGSQRYPVGWAGDPVSTFPTIATTIRGGLSQGLSGVPFWSHDIGGIGNQDLGLPTEEVYIRWAQAGLLCSHSRAHGCTPRQPWKHSERATRIFRDFAKLRYRLLPYICTYAHEASETGLPVMRAMVLEYQDDPGTYTLDLQYLLGKELLVAPIFDESSVRQIYLPKGKWFDYWSDTEYEGPGYVTYAAPLEIIPLLVRGDSIIPLGPEISFVGERPLNPLTAEVYCLTGANFQVRDDEETIALACRRSEGSVEFDIRGEATRTCIVRFHALPSPREVRASERALPSHDTIREFDAAVEGWHVENSGTVCVKVIVRGEDTINLDLGRPD